MSTITEKLDKLNTIKQDIKSVLIEKGKEPTDNFETYADIISELGYDVKDSFTMEETGTILPEKPTLYKNIVYNGRTFKANTWFALCLPFDVNQDDIKNAFGNAEVQVFITRYAKEEIDESGSKWYMLGTLEEDGPNLHYTREYYIRAYTPILMFVENEVSNPTFTNKIIDPNAKKNIIKYQDVSVIPTVDADTIYQYDTYLNGSGAFAIRTSASTTTIKGWRFLIRPYEEYKQKLADGWRILSTGMILQ